MAFNQGAPTVPTLINSSNVFIFGNTSSGNALSVQQLGAGNVVSFSNASGGSNVFVMNNLGYVGIGTTNPQSKLHVEDQDNSSVRIYQYSALDGPVLRCYRALGTQAIPTAVTTNSVLGAIRGFGYTSSSTYSIGSAQINMYAAESYTSSAQGSYITLSTTATGGNTLAERMRITSGGLVGIGTTSPASTLDLAGGTLTSRYITSPGGNYLTIQNGAGGSAISLLGTTTAITGGAVYMTGGNVGIGTDAPAAKLGVVVSGSATVSGPSWDASWFTVGTAGNSIANAVGLGWSTGGNNGILACVQPTVGWRNMAYTAAVHDFYIAGTFVTSIRNAMTGGATTISVDASGYIQRGAVSDQRLKSNIMTMTDFGLATITGLRPVTYEATPESLPRIGAGTHVGLVAQEVQTVFPYAVSADQNEQKTLTIDYIKLVPVMINAFKELSAENTALKTQLTAMDARLASLEAKLNSQ
jgi:hypothetical protein